MNKLQKTVQRLFNDLAGFDTSYEEFEQLSEEEWTEKKLSQNW